MGFFKLVRIQPVDVDEKKVTGNNPYMPYSAQISQNQDEHNIYVIMKTYMLLCLSCFCEI